MHVLLLKEGLGAANHGIVSAQLSDWDIRTKLYQSGLAADSPEPLASNTALVRHLRLLSRSQSVSLWVLTGDHTKCLPSSPQGWDSRDLRDGDRQRAWEVFECPCSWNHWTYVFELSFPLVLSLNSFLWWSYIVKWMVKSMDSGQTAWVPWCGSDVKVSFSSSLRPFACQ